VARLEAFADLLRRWNARLNLIGRETEADLWTRHIEDSLQLIPHLPKNAGVAADIGSGAGFPGLVLTIATGRPFLLVESDRRKAAFLSEAARLAGAPAKVLAARVEQTAPLGAALITARAFAPLPRLLELTTRHLAPDGHLLLLKGRAAGDELTAARRDWHMRVERFPSRTDPDASILRLSEIRPARSPTG
jgi:16S rRNA (guanine(527)-N(7))-methyltransferase RsmG